MPDIPFYVRGTEGEASILYLSSMKFFISFLFNIFFFTTEAQHMDSSAVRHTIDSINRLIDQSVVQKDLAILKKHYADDFYFRHGSGKIDSKKSWLDNVMNISKGYISRMHDSVTVELHKDIAIVSGTLVIERLPVGKRSKYIRVFVRRKKVWQLLSHNTIYEWDTKPPGEGVRPISL